MERGYKYRVEEWAFDLWRAVTVLTTAGFIVFLVLYVNAVKEPSAGTAEAVIHWECHNTSDIDNAVAWATAPANAASKNVKLHAVFSDRVNCRACKGAEMVYGDPAMWESHSSCASFSSHDEFVKLGDGCQSTDTMPNMVHPHNYGTGALVIHRNCGGTAGTGARRLLQDYSLINAMIAYSSQSNSLEYGQMLV